MFGEAAAALGEIMRRAGTRRRVSGDHAERRVGALGSRSWVGRAALGIERYACREPRAVWRTQR